MGAVRAFENGREEAISVLFGPQGDFSSESLLELRTSIQEHSSLKFLRDTISELPSLWSAISEDQQDLNHVGGEDKLAELNCFFQNESGVTFLKPTDNVILCPLTVISHLVDFWKLTHGINVSSPDESQLRNVQGFCLGLLSAIAISCSKTEIQFQSLASKAIRLAVCMGALVDADALHTSDCSSAIAVRWKSATQLQHLRDTLTLYPSVSDVGPHFSIYPTDSMCRLMSPLLLTQKLPQSQSRRATNLFSCPIWPD